jgi:hypothetical protein
MTKEKLRADVLAAIPDAWLDPLLSGQAAVIREPITPRQIEELLTRIRTNISAVLDLHGIKGAKR